MKHCSMITALLMALALVGVPTAHSEEAALPQMDVYKSPSCGCCGKWVTHLEQSGFGVSVENTQRLDRIKADLGIAPALQSCHTAVASNDAGPNYVFEGHIPAKVIARFLREQPAGAIGLSVPGMPLGSPGMEVNDRFDPYDVLLIQADGSSRVYTHIATPEQQY